MRRNWELYTGCVTGAARVDELRTMLAETGFERVRIEPKPQSREMLQEWFPHQGLEDHVASAIIEAVKPAR